MAPGSLERQYKLMVSPARGCSDGAWISKWAALAGATPGSIKKLAIRNERKNNNGICRPSMKQ